MTTNAFEYQLLARLQQDCEYYLGFGERNPKHLWALNEAEQIQKMKELYAALPEKPEWISLADIERYEGAMVAEAPAPQALRYIPVAEYDIGLCPYGKREPYKTVTVRADSLEAAMIEGRKLLKPSAVEHICHVATRPNPEHVESMKDNPR